MREQVCIYMCPWPRIQAALTDEWALNVTYRRDRGEPRMSVKKAEQLRMSRASRQATASTATSASPSVRPASTSATASSSAASSAGCASTPATRSCRRSAGRPDLSPTTPTSISRADAPASRRSTGSIRPRTILYTAVIAVVGVVMLYTPRHPQLDERQRAARTQPALSRSPTAAFGTTTRCASSTRPACPAPSRWR